MPYVREVIETTPTNNQRVHGYYHDLPPFLFEYWIVALFIYSLTFSVHYIFLDKGIKRDFSIGKKTKKDKDKRDSDDDGRKTSLRIGSSSKKGRSAEMNMQRGSLKKRDKSKDKEEKEAKSLERRKVILPE
jgi:hypothetical protein